MNPEERFTAKELAVRVITVARQHPEWCGQVNTAWEAIFPGVPLLDSEGYSLRGYDAEGYNPEGFNEYGLRRGESVYHRQIRRLTEAIEEEQEHQKVCRDCRTYPRYLTSLRNDLEIAIRHLREWEQENAENSADTGASEPS